MSIFFSEIWKAVVSKVETVHTAVESKIRTTGPRQQFEVGHSKEAIYKALGLDASEQRLTETGTTEKADTSDTAEEITNERIGDSRELRRNMEADGKESFEGAEAHHLIPCQVLRDTPLGKLLIERFGVNIVDSATNGKFLPGSETSRAAAPDGEKLPVHRGSHGNYSRGCQELGDTLYEDLLDEYGSPENIPDDVLSKVFEAWTEAAEELLEEPEYQSKDERRRLI